MTDRTAQRHLAAIVSADVAGYSRLMGYDEEGTLAALRAHRHELIDPAIASHGGRVVKTMGDGLLLEFSSVVNAVRCCLEVQSAMLQRNAGVPPDRQIAFRVGINLGDVIAEGDDIFGEGVNVAARLEALADPGGICISEGALQQAGRTLGLVTEDMGARALKNIEAPIRVFRIRGTSTEKGAALAPAKAGAVTVAHPLPPERPSLAILPFRNLSTDPDAAFIADGVALGLQTLLVQLSGIFFVNACMHKGYREGAVTAAQAVAGMPVRYGIEGAVQRAGSRLRVNVQVSELATGALIWAESFDGGLDDVFAMQDEIARRIASALSVQLVGGHLASDFTAGLGGSDAWEHFLRGVDHLYRWTKHDIAAAIPHFEALAQAHPESAIGPCYLSLLHYTGAKEHWIGPEAEALAQAAKWAERAVAREPGNNGLGHAVLGALRLAERKHDESRALCRKAVAYRSNCPFAHNQLGQAETYMGNPSTGIKHLREALAVRVQHPPSMINALAVAYRDDGLVEQSIPAAQETLRAHPDFNEARVTLCSDFVLGGDLGAARRTAAEIVAGDPGFTVSGYAETQPYRDAVPLERLSEALRACGLPG